MKWLPLFLLLSVVLAVGCSKGSAGRSEPAKSPAEEKVDMTLEKAAMNPASTKPAAAKYGAPQ